MSIRRNRLKVRSPGADLPHMGPGGSVPRRRWVATAVLAALTTILLMAVPSGHVAVAATGEGDLTAGEVGSGAPAFPTRVPQATLRGGITWSDIGGSFAWVRPAANWVGEANTWMRDYRANADGTYPFRPGRLEPRDLFARALVRALAPDEPVDPQITFTDLDAGARFFPYANVAVKLGWLGRTRSGAFLPNDPVSTATASRAFVRALGLRGTARTIDGLRTADGVRFATPRNVGVLMLALRLGLRYNNRSDESQDVGPRTLLNRAQVAHFLYRATTLEDWVVPYVADQYTRFVLPRMNERRRQIVRWGLRFVGYPYIWGGEWGLESPEPAALGGQPGPGFDCSGLMWWLLRRNDGGAWNVAPPRPYAAWSLPQRTSRDMAAMAPQRIRFRDLRPGDLMFYDGDGDQIVDHVDVYVGNGWAIDSGSSVGGVTFMWVGTGWYRDHFRWGRRIIGRR